MAAMSIAMTTLVVGVIFCDVTWSTRKVCPGDCRCDSGVVDCSDTTTSLIPQQLPLNTTTLKLQGNDLSELWHGVFPPLPVVIEIDLSNNDIAYIGAHSFFAQPFLKKLNLAHNSIEYLLDNAFSGLRLIKLNLNDNPLRDLSENAFDNTTIEELSLNGCRLRTLPVRLFRDMTHTLRVLNLNNNHFPLQLPGGVLANLHFSKLNMKDNGMRNLRCLSNASVDKLDMSGNPVGDGIWSALNHATIIKEIFCHGCGVRSFNITEYFPSIHTISLEDNAINAIDEKSFAKVPNLRTLNLHNNRIRHLGSNFDRHLQKLSILDLSWNFLDDLKAESIDEMSLTYLDLSENSLMSVPEYLRPILGEIRTVVLYGNPFRCNCLMLWFYRWTKSLTWRDTQIWGAECRYPKKGPLLEYRPDELTCKRPEITEKGAKLNTPKIYANPNAKANTVSDVNTNGTSGYKQNMTVTCAAVGEPLPVIELLLPSGERIAKYPTRNEAGIKVSVSHTLNVDCSDQLNVVCSVANFISNISDTITVNGNKCVELNMLNKTSQTEPTEKSLFTPLGQLPDSNQTIHLNYTDSNISRLGGTKLKNSTGILPSYVNKTSQVDNILLHNSSWNEATTSWSNSTTDLTTNDSMEFITMATREKSNMTLHMFKSLMNVNIDLNVTHERLINSSLDELDKLIVVNGSNIQNDDMAMEVFQPQKDTNNSSMILNNTTEVDFNIPKTTSNNKTEFWFANNSSASNASLDYIKNETSINFSENFNDNFTDSLITNNTDWSWFASETLGGSNVSYVIDLHNSATTWLRNTLVTILKGCIGFVVVVVSVTLIIVIGRVIYHNSNHRMDYNLSKQRANFVRNHLMNTMRIIRPISTTTTSSTVERCETKH